MYEYYVFFFVSVTYSETYTFTDHFFLDFLGFFFLLSPDFHELWRSMTSTRLITEVKQQWATLVLGWVTA